MRFEPREMSDRLMKMLDRVGRGELARDGFSLDDDALEASVRLSPGDFDHAVFHALFRKDAPHAATISPLAAPATGGTSDELVKWTVEKQAQTAQLDREHAEARTERILAALAAAAKADDVRAERDAADQAFIPGAILVSADRSADQATRLLLAVQAGGITAHDDATSIAQRAERDTEKTRIDLRDEIERVVIAVRTADGERAQAAGRSEVATAEAAVVASQRWTHDAAARLNLANLAETAQTKRARAAAVQRWIQIAIQTLILIGLAALVASKAHAQGTTVQGLGVAGTQAGKVVTVQGDPAGTAVPVTLGGTVPLPTGAATSALQTTGNTSLSTIATDVGNIPAQGQALAAGSTPVVLTAAQLSTLTPPAAIAGFATSALQTTGNSSLSTIATNIPAQGQALAAGSTPVVLTAIQLAALQQVNAIPQSSSTYALTAYDTTTTAATNIKGSGGNVWGWYGENANTTTCYLTFFNNASTGTLGTNQLHSFGIAPGASFNMAPGSLALFNLSSGIATGQTTTATGSGTCTTFMQITILYN